MLALKTCFVWCYMHILMMWCINIDVGVGGKYTENSQNTVKKCDEVENKGASEFSLLNIFSSLGRRCMKFSSLSMASASKQVRMRNLHRIVVVLCGLPSSACLCSLYLCVRLKLILLLQQFSNFQHYFSSSTTLNIN